MFDNLSEHSQIFVSGPQRSGTRICTKMVAHDTGHRFIDETEAKWLFLGKSITDKDTNWDDVSEIIVANAQNLIDTKSKFVLHCPPFMPWLHRIKGAFVVVTRRSVDDIVKSINRIGWKRKRQEFEYNKMGYTRFGNKRRFAKTYKPIAELKYEYWDNVQRDKIADQKEVSYESLKDHELWISKRDRSNFRWDQTL